MSLSLFYSPRACSMVPYIALTEAAAEFDVRVVNMMKAEHMSAEYLAVNPKHKVPVLLIDGKPLTENVAILLWIARKYPATKLIPTDSDQEIKVISFLAWCASGVHPTITPHAMPHFFCDLPDSAESVKRVALKRLTENYQIAEDMLAGKQWFFDEFSVADVYFFWCFRRGNQFGYDLSQFKNLQAHMARMLQRPSVQTLVAFEAKTMAELSAAKA
jgi:glutathione S-transferase